MTAPTPTNPTLALPTAPTSERALVGCLLADPHTVGPATLSAIPCDAFTDLVLRRIWQGARDLSDHTQANVERLTDLLAGDDLVDHAGGPEYLSHLVDDTPTTALWEDHVKAVVGSWRARQRMQAAERLQQAAATGDAEAEEAALADLGVDDQERPLPRVTAKGGDGTELWFARLLVREHGADLRFVAGWGKWATWSQTAGRWILDDSGEIARRGKAVVDRLLGEAQQMISDAAVAGDRRAALKQAQSLLATGRRFIPIKHQTDHIIHGRQNMLATCAGFVASCFRYWSTPANIGSSSAK